MQPIITDLVPEFSFTLPKDSIYAKAIMEGKTVSVTLSNTDTSVRFVANQAVLSHTPDGDLRLEFPEHIVREKLRGIGSLNQGVMA